MTTILRRFPLVAYFAVAYVIAWTGVHVVAAVFGPSLIGMFIPMAAGPTIAALLLTGVTDGKQGYRVLVRRLTRWRIGARWYALLLLSPLLIVATLAMLRFASPVFIPRLFTTEDPLALIGFSIAAGLAAGLFEEVGWTGFVTPRMLARRAYLHVGLMLGVLWASWHIGPELTDTREWGALLPLRILCWMYASMVPYRILMTRAYQRTGSVFLAVLLHATFTGGQFLLEPAGVDKVQALIWWTAFGAAVWIAVGITLWFERRFAATSSERRRHMPRVRTRAESIQVIDH
jgi:uncharacterized protein